MAYVKYNKQMWTVYASGLIIKDKVDTWDGTIDDSGFQGEGTQENPYLIYSAEQMAYFAQQVNNGNRYENVCFKLMISLDLRQIPWLVVGGNLEDSADVNNLAEGNLFNGTFEGNDLNIYNLNAQYELAEGVGLFGALGTNGKISNLTIKNGEILGRLAVGSISGVNYGTIEECHNYATVTAKSYNGEARNGNYAGGITGYNFADITRCSNSGNITATNGNDAWNGGWAAGIAGYSTGNISHSSNSGEVNAKHYRAGGIAGTFRLGTITNCTNTGKIYAGWRGAGGIVGLCSDGGKITGCINKGNVSAITDEAGGIAGNTTGAANGNTVSIIEECINYGIIQAGDDGAGGISGGVESTGDIIISCTNNGDVCGLDDGTISQNDIGGIVGTGCGLIINCTNNGNITAYGQTVGGIMGRGYGTIEGCINNGEVNVYKDKSNSSTSGLYAGGIIGYLKANEQVEDSIINCENKGKVSGLKYISGIVGASTGDEVIGCHNSGKIQGEQYISGIVGYSTNPILDSTNNGEIVGTSSYIGGVVAYSTKSVTNCSNNSIVKCAANYVGGIVGYITGGSITNCENNEYVEAGGNIAGGIAGSLQSSGDTISGCVNKGDICAKGYMSGGIAGRNRPGSIITQCENYGKISADAGINGGICGYSCGGITYVANYGDINSDSKVANVSGTYPNAVGGIVGCLLRSNLEYAYNEGNISIKNNISIIDSAGGIVGEVGEKVDTTPEPAIAYVYNKGTVTCDEYKGNIAGQQLYGNKVANSYYLNTLTGTGIGYIGADIVNYTPTQIQDELNITTAISNNFSYSEFISWLGIGGN